MAISDVTSEGVNAYTVTTIGGVRINAQAVTKSQRPLVAALALRRTSGATIDVLVDAIWPDRAPSTAKTSVQNQIGRLRRSFGRELIVSDGDRYHLDATTDVEMIDRLVQRCDGRPLGPDDAQAIASALSDWNGEPYADLPEHRWADAERARLHHVQSKLVEQLALSRLVGSQVDLDAAVIDLSVRTSTEPLHEQAWELLVAALHLAGRRTEALAAYGRFSTVLQCEIGAAPSRRFQQLRALIDADQPIEPEAILTPAPVVEISLRATA